MIVKTIKMVRRYRIIFVMPDGSNEAECRTWPSLEIANGMANRYVKERAGPSSFFFIKEDDIYE